MMRPESFWLDTAPAFTGVSPLPVEGRADVVVVGAGFTGLSAALTLAGKGIGVTVLEAGKVASEASGRNGGQVCANIIFSNRSWLDTAHAAHSSALCPSHCAADRRQTRSDADA